jgi:hypothetical protein
LGSVQWQPAEGVDCPEDQPISACDVDPADEEFTIALQLFRSLDAE